MQGWREPTLRSHEGGISLHPLGQRLVRFVLGGEHRCRLGTGIDFMAKDRGDEVSALREVTIKRPDSDETLRAKYFQKMVSDEYSLDVVEQLIPVAQSAGLSLSHMAVAFVLAHAGITAAIIGPGTMPQFDDLWAGVDVRLDDTLLDRIDQIVPPGTDVAPLEGSAYTPPALKVRDLRRRPIAERSAA